MATLTDYKGQVPAWCPGCGDFGILNALKATLVEMNIEPHEVVLVSGIGQAAKLPHYAKGNTFNGLHGRALPPATGIKLANHNLHVIVTTGDGDCYGEGGNHLMHAIRRNVNIKVFVHDNQIYGLTKGQASPTTLEGTLTRTQPFGVHANPFNPIAVAVALDCSFVARAYTAEPELLKSVMKEAINHKGFSLVDILQPCVTFNKVNTYKWYQERCYHIDKAYDPYNRVEAFKLSLEPFTEHIALGVIYKHDKPAFEDYIPIIKDTPLVKQPFQLEKMEKELQNFY